jgi:pimeloyl-ACP methyl ester carboxylesterase
MEQCIKTDAHTHTGAVKGNRMRAFQSALSILAFSFASAMPAAIADESFYDVPPPGRLIDLGGYRLHIHCQGMGSPTVVLDAGLGDWSTHWTAVQNLLKTDTRVCSYDRAGYGWSDPGPRPRDSQRIVAELHSLLEKASVEPPYVLVGHSFGGLNMRLFASTYVGEVAGLVLVEASHPESLPYQRNEAGTAPSTSPANQLMVVHPVEPEVLPVPPEAQSAINDNLLRTKSRVTSRGEYRALGHSVLELQRSRPFGDLPLTVLSRGKREWPYGEDGDLKEKSWQLQQMELARLSNLSHYIVATNSGHHIHIDQPDLVAGVVRDMISEDRRESASLLR